MEILSIASRIICRNGHQGRATKAPTTATAARDYQPVLGTALSVTAPRGSSDGGTKTMRLGGSVAATDGAAAR